MNVDRMPTSDSNGNDNDKNDAAKDDADADEHIMRDRFTFNRKTVMRAARNVAVPEPDWRSCCAPRIRYADGGLSGPADRQRGLFGRVSR